MGVVAIQRLCQSCAVDNHWEVCWEIFPVYWLHWIPYLVYCLNNTAHYCTNAKLTFIHQSLIKTILVESWCQVHLDRSYLGTPAVSNVKCEVFSDQAVRGSKSQLHQPWTWLLVWVNITDPGFLRTILQFFYWKDESRSGQESRHFGAKLLSKLSRIVWYDFIVQVSLYTWQKIYKMFDFFTLFRDIYLCISNILMSNIFYFKLSAISHKNIKSIFRQRCWESSGIFQKMFTK